MQPTEMLSKKKKKKAMENVAASGTVMNAGMCQLSTSKRMQI